MVAGSRQLDQVRINENTRKNLEGEISGYKAEAHKQRKQLFLLEKDGEKYGAGGVLGGDGGNRAF